MALDHKHSTCHIPTLQVVKNYLDGVLWCCEQQWHQRHMANSAEHEVHACVCPSLHHMQCQGYGHSQYSLLMDMVAKDEAAEGGIGHCWQEQVGLWSVP